VRGRKLFPFPCVFYYYSPVPSWFDFFLFPGSVLFRRIGTSLQGYRQTDIDRDYSMTSPSAELFLSPKILLSPRYPFPPFLIFFVDLDNREIAFKSFFPRAFSESVRPSLFISSVKSGMEALTPFPFLFRLHGHRLLPSQTCGSGLSSF